MTTRIKNIDPYCNLHYSQEASDALEQLGQLFASATKLEQVSASCEALTDLQELTFSVESFSDKVKSVLKRFWDFLIQLANNMYEVLKKQYTQNPDNKAYEDGTIKREAKETPTPEDDRKVIESLLKIGKVIDAAIKNNDASPVDVTVDLPYSDRKVDVLTRKLQGLLQSNYKRLSGKLAILLPGVEFKDLSNAIFAAHYSVSDSIMELLGEIKRLNRDPDITKIKQLRATLDTKSELIRLTKMIGNAANSTESDASSVEAYKNAILSLNLRLKEEENVSFTSAEVIVELFDKNKHSVFAAIERTSSLLAAIAKDKLGSDIKFLLTILNEAKSTDLSKVDNNDAGYIKDVLSDVMFMLQATDAFIRMIRECVATERTYVRKFLDLQTFLSADKE